MNTVIAGWLKVIGAGAAAVGGTVLAGPLDTRTAIIAICAFFASAGSAAFALAHPTAPVKTP